MTLKNIILKTAELGPVEWQDVEKLQPSKSGYICFISAEPIIKEDADNTQQTHLLGTYFETTFKEKPSYKEVINFLITAEYPDGKELQMLRYGVFDPQNEEYIEYYQHAEDIRATIKQLLS